MNQVLQEQGAKEGSDVNFKEVALDKLIDLILIFVGFYAAVWLQGYQDARKEREDYKRLLDDFKTELVANQKEKGAVEKDLGPIADNDPGKALGPMQASLDQFKKEASEAEKLVGCLSLVIEVGQRGRPTPEEQEKVTACAPLLEAAEKAGEDTSTPFKPANLTPFYRDEVKQIYLAGGVKVFENKALAVKVTQSYTNADKIEKLVDEVERLYNDEFMKMDGEVRALGAELEDAVPSGEPTLAQLAPLQATLSKTEAEIRKLRYQMEKVHGQLELKVIRIKELVATMDQQIAAVVGDIDAELAKLR